nr:hypothetical protein [Tanacetum cinerariifolium]
MTTLAEFMIIVGAENRPLMLEKSMYDSWKSRMELYIEYRENGRMILKSVQNGPLVWPTIVKENGTTRIKKYEELSVTEKLQADSDLKATNIVLQGLPPDVYAIGNHHKVSKEIRAELSFLCKARNFHYKKGNVNCLVVPVFTQGDDLIACLNKAIAFLSVVVALRFPLTNNQLRTFFNPRNHATIQNGKPKRPRNAAWFKDKAMLAEAQESGQILDEEQLAFLADPSIPNVQTAQTTSSNNVAFQNEDLDAYDSDYDDVTTAQAVLMANYSNFGSDV